MLSITSSITSSDLHFSIQLNLQEQDEPMISCLVRDLSNGARKISINILPSATCQDLIDLVADRLSCSSVNFSLFYDDTESGIAEADGENICLNEISYKKLEAIIRNTDRQNFYLTSVDGLKIQKQHGIGQGSKISDKYKNSVTSNISKPIGLGTIITDSIGSNASSSETKDSSIIRSSYANYNLSSSFNKSETGLVGLVNQAMTCYLNSLLQTLYMTPEFRNAVYRWKFEGTEEEGAMSIPYQLQRLFLLLQTSKKKSVGTVNITRSFGWEHSESWQQHDVQELCRVMFDALEKTWQNTEQADLISRLYQGKMKDCVCCLKCGWESAKIVAYQDIPLVVKPFGECKEYGSVEESLAGFCSFELLDGNNQWFCEKCAMKVDAHKSLKFITFPYILTMHLMRFDFDYSTMRRIKLNYRVTFPDILDLNTFVTKDSETPTRNCNGDGHPLLPTEGKDGGCSDSVSSSDDTDTVSCASSMDSLVNGNQNACQSNQTGPYEYELFSIMVHSGNATGGHYYAYIKSFESGQWCSFNDQHVTPITNEDISKTFGGESSTSHTYLESSYQSSTNAYMLIYRQIDPEQNSKFTTVDEFPEHLREELQRIQEKEDSDRLQQEIERNTCKIKLFVFHPIEQKSVEMSFAVHMDKTLSEATDLALKLFRLENVIPRDCVRLVKYDGLHDYIDRSFDNQDDFPIHKILGGVKYFYGFDLLLEIKRADQAFAVYKPGGVSIKTFVVDLSSETITPPFTVRAYLTQTVSDLKGLIASELNVEPNSLRIVLDTRSELKLLQDPDKLLKPEGFGKSNKIFVEYSGSEDDQVVDFQNTKFFELLDRFENTIRIRVHLPKCIENETGTSPNNNGVRPKCQLKPSSNDLSSNAVEPPKVDNSSPPDNELPLSSVNGSSEKSESSRPDDVNYASPFTKLSNEDLNVKNGFESRWELDRGDCSASKPVEDPCAKYFRACLQIDAETKERSLTVSLDKRMMVISLKQCLQSYVGVGLENFEVFRMSTNAEEIELKRPHETFSIYDDDCQFKVKIGRSLKKGEYRVKVQQLLVNELEHVKFLSEAVISKGQTVLQAKQSIIEELETSKLLSNLDISRCRLRKKTWKNPGNIYNDWQAFDDEDICLVPNMDIFFEVLKEPDTLRNVDENEQAVYIRRWWPSKYELGGIQEIIINDSPNNLLTKISEVSGLVEENIQFAKVSITFPCDMSVFDIHNNLVWNPCDEFSVSYTLKSLAVYSDGAMFFYRDKSEVLKQLTVEQKKELQQKENSKISSYSTTCYPRKKERALKIYTDFPAKPAPSLSDIG